ncbi:uncharacterized protein LOC115891183 [Sitophilus oryzae]|uniref:RNA-directed DNA polymerase n=1 Tax=Sitophilus oryzae TaxID=7048 RepID=A0A6J2YVZ2_SITOR|nr:uncharacterized protein LOC115891183 [Sitophilus oryzae]
MDIYNFRPSHLLDYELDYELFIRQSATTRPVADKRKILSRLLASEKSKPGNNIQLANIELDFNKEQEAIGKSLNSVNLIIEDFEGAESDSTFLRVKSRLSHIAGRVQHIISFSLDPKLLPLVKTYISETNATCLKLEGDLYDKIPSTSNTNESFVSNPVINIPTPIVSCSSRSQPVSEWQIKFDGTELSDLCRCPEEADYLTKKDKRPKECISSLDEPSPSCSKMNNRVCKSKVSNKGCIPESSDGNEVSPVFVNKSLDNRPYISVKLYDISVSVLLDSGATASVVGSKDDLSIEQRIRAENVIASFDEISSQDKLGRTDKIPLNIDTGDAPPFKRRPFSMSPYMAKILNDELDEMLQLGVIEPSKSPYCSPVLLVKKANGEYRFCFDGRPLNEVTKHDCYPLPNVERILSSLRNSKFISSIDLRKAFWQIPLDERSKEKTAFAVVGRGFFQFVTMPFGLRNAAQTQQRLVDAIFSPKFEPHIFTYLDDILVISEDFYHHIKLLTEVKEKLREAGLSLNLKKCDFFKTTLKFLGYVVGSNSLRTDPDKVSAMANYPQPRTTTKIKRFVGLCSWYRHFIKDFSTLMSPINDLLKGRKKGQSIEWNTKAEHSFLHIKDLLLSAPILSQPNFSEKFFIESDASDTGLGGVLLQKIDGEDYNHSLLWLNNLSNPSGKLARWSVRLRKHTFDIIHKKGVSNVIADAMSRIPGSEDVQEHTPDISEERPQRQEVIDSCHSPPTSGHFGFFKTLNRVQELHYWPKMREDILRFVRNCEVCGAQKAPNTARMGLMGKEKVVDLPFQVIAIELIGPLPRSKIGQFYRSEVPHEDLEIVPGDCNSYAANLQNFKDIFIQVRSNLHLAHERNSRSYNLRKRDVSFNVGDHVWHRNKVLSSAADKFSTKLVPKCIHSIVRKKLPNLVYNLEDLDGSKAGNWHIKYLKPFNHIDNDQRSLSSED